MRGVTAGIAQQSLAELHDQTAFLGDGDEFQRRYGAEAWTVPPRQRLEADDPTRFDVDERLIMDRNRVGGDRLAKLPLDQHAACHVLVHVRFKEPHQRASFRLGAVECHVSPPQQLFRCAAVVRSHRNADADAERHGDISDNEGVRKRRHDAMRKPRGIGQLDFRHDDGELVASDPRHERAGAQRRGHAAGKFDQSLVAGAMAVHVVDGLETIEIEHQHGGPLVVGGSMPQYLLEPFGKKAPVGQTRQRVMPRQPAGFQFRGLPRVDLAGKILAAPVEIDEQRHAQHRDDKQHVVDFRIRIVENELKQFRRQVE